MGCKQHRIAMITLMLLFFSVAATWTADAIPRYALVIGNGAYQTMTRLANPVNDATDLAAELSEYGFSVELVTNATLGEMVGAVQRFVDIVGQSSGAEAALFYYAGHGVQFNGSNYLIPVNANIQASYELLDKSMGMDSVVRGLEQSGSNFNLIVLDACRDNPFFSTRGGDRGLSVMGTGGRGSMVVFATSPGDIAQDGIGRNSPFTGAFLEAMRVPGVEIRQLVTTVQRKVQEQTGGSQVPWVNLSYTGEFYFQTIEQQLKRSQEELAGLQDELAALEKEIAQREAAIKAAGSVEERRRLEAEQATTKALEIAKQIEAQRASEMENQAREVLNSLAIQDALREEMDVRLSSQAEALSRQAEQRKAELEYLRMQQAETDQSLQARLGTIAQYNRAIQDIQMRYTQVIQTVMDDLDVLHDSKVAAFRMENPRDPWETVIEHDIRLKDGLASLATATEIEKARERVELERRLQGEVDPLRASLETAQSELHGMRFEVSIDSATVHVGTFDTEAKQFPITVSVQDGSVSFTQSLFYKIESRDREIIKNEYYRVYSAAQSGALVGKIAYRVFKLEGKIWTVFPEYVEVVNLLEEDSVLSKAWERGKFVESSPATTFSVDDSVVGVSLGELKYNLMVSGLPLDSVVYVNGVRQPDSTRDVFTGNVGNSRGFTVRVESPWISRDLVMRYGTKVGNGKVAFCDISDLVEPIGILSIPRPDLKVSLYGMGIEKSEISMDLSRSGYSVKLTPGKYAVLAKLPEDRYGAFSGSVIVNAGERTVFDPGPVKLSVLHRYEETLKEQDVLRQALRNRAPAKKIGWSAVGVAAAGIAGSVVSYLLYSNAMENYENAILSSDLMRYRGDAELWSKLFTVSLAVGVAGGVTSGTVFAIDVPKTRRLSEQIVEKEQLADKLKQEMDAQQAREAMDAFMGRNVGFLGF
ncbi:MAG: caspase family protein [Sphaerochaeta sp.]|nr:caspase family protein [Sphaerochaeta sp.]